MSIINNAPYYDKYDSSKNYTQLLAVPGRVAQARELTEIQTTMKDIIKSLGDSIMNDGNVIEGCQVIPDIVNKKVTVTAGKVYMRGMVMNLPESTIGISASGTELIGVRLREYVVYETDDPDLKDPALGYENYNQPGCDRLKSVLELINITDIDEDSAISVLATLINGEVSVEQQAPNYSALNETLARRTYDESGSYIVEGMNVRVEADNSDTDTFKVVVESGKAYVHGYEVKLSSARRLSMPRSLSSTRVTARYNYAPDTNYLLTTGPYVKSINTVESALQVSESVSINNGQGAALQQSTAYNIVKVEKNGETIDSTNYRLEQGPTSYIRWNNTSYPGDNVVVTYYYTVEFKEDRDYELYTENNNHYLKWKSTTLAPITGETLTINYDKYLARKDTVYVDQDGQVSIVQGTPADYGFEVAESAPAYTLSLATVMSPPGGTVTRDTQVNISVSNVGLTRFTMSDIHKMLKRIRTLEYDQTILSLNTEAKDYATEDKRGIFTDPFVDYSKLDFYFNLNAGAALLTDRPIYDAAVDLDSNMVYLPLINKMIDVEFDDTNSGVLTKSNSTVALGKTGEKVVLSQLQATKSYLISPYLVYPQTPEIFITPSVDTWYDDTIVEVPKSLNTTETVSTSTRYHPDNIIYSYHYRGWTSTSTWTTTSNIGTKVDTVISENVISEESLTYIRPREISVSGSYYPPGIDNIKCYFDGIETPLTPTGSTTAGTASGSIKADANGSFTAKFTVPSGVLTGTRVVTLESDIAVSGYTNSAFTFYTSTGTARTIQRTVTTITTVLQQRVTNVQTTIDYDPLAQTFILDSMSLLSGVDIYFENVPTGNVPVTCEIREVVNGNITSKIYGFKTLRPSEITISADSSKATRFTFNDPVLIEANTEYAFVLKSSSQDYRIFVAEIGEANLQTNELVSANPYLLGVMMSSSNNMSWTTHQKTDIKFRLISDTYQSSSDVLFKNINLESGFCKAYLTADSLVFEDTRIDWFYSLDEGVTFNTFSPYNPLVLDQLATDITLKARMSRASSANISPILALDTVSLSLTKYDNAEERHYISNMITGLDEYDTVEIVLDTYEPSGTSLTVYVSPSNNSATPYIMKEGELQSSVESNYGWFEKTYKVTLDNPATQCRLFVKMESDKEYHTPAFRRLRAIMS